MATYFSSNASSECWLIDISYTNHMTYDKNLFKELEPGNITKVRIRNGKQIAAEGKGIIAITTCSSTKTISDVLYIAKISHNLLSFGQLLKGVLR